MNQPVSCPGCGADYRTTCAYCGRGNRPGYARASSIRTSTRDAWDAALARYGVSNADLAAAEAQRAKNEARARKRGSLLGALLGSI